MTELKPPFKISAPSMVHGPDTVMNVRLLSDVVDHVEIVLFHTPTLHNIPSGREIQELIHIKEEESLGFSVHLPSSLEIAHEDRATRDEALRFTIELCARTTELNPEHFILHIPISTPTLTAVPGQYYTEADLQRFSDWTKRASEALERLQASTGLGDRLLVENINYSPSYLDPFLERGVSGLCLDLGHLMLGREEVLENIRRRLHVTDEIHFHGVKGYEEHLSLSVLPFDAVREWITYLVSASYDKVLNLEVFSPEDLDTSMTLVFEALNGGS